MNMNFHDSTHDVDPTEAKDCRCGATEARRPSFSRKMRLLSRLMRAEMRKTLQADPSPTRGEVKAAARAIEERVVAAVPSEDLAITLATLDRITEAFGGRDALPFRPHGRRGHGHRGFGPGPHGRRGHRAYRGFDPRAAL